MSERHNDFLHNTTYQKKKSHFYTQIGDIQNVTPNKGQFNFLIDKTFPLKKTEKINLDISLSPSML